LEKENREKKKEKRCLKDGSWKLEDGSFVYKKASSIENA